MRIAQKIRLDDEAGRLAALRRYEVLDTGREPEFDEIADLARSVFGVPFVAINLIDQDRQWMKAAAGGEPFVCDRTDAFCNHTIRTAAPLTVSDATADPRFARNPFVTGDAGVRAYLGAPLMSPDGYNIGALCMTDVVPRAFTPAEGELLKGFARVVMSQLELRLAARVDALTGVQTRRAFLARVDAAIAARREASLIVLDLDHFKAVNDTCGHPVGDEVLRRTAASIAAGIRKTDSLGRLGGEEFGLLLPDTGPAEALGLAERIRATIGTTPLDVLGGRVVTLSLGVTEYRPDESRDDWFARADVALYRAKHAGRNRTAQADAGGLVLPQ